MKHPDPLYDESHARTELCLCLSLGLDPQTSGALRRRIMGGGWVRVVETALELRLEAALAWVSRDAQLFAGIPADVRTDGRETAPAALDRIWREHLARRQAMLARLEELVAALNMAGITPLLLKGARSLWTGAPEWRALRDLDLLAYGDAERAQAVALANGYRLSDSGQGRHPQSFYHADNLYRDDLPGWVEVHRLAGSTRSEILLGSRELVGVATPMSRRGATALILPPVYDLLHGMIHHHAGHREARDGALELKGLFEFARGFAALSADDRVTLAARAGRDSRLLAMVDLWVAASTERFATRPEAPFAVEADAITRWRKLQDTGRRPSKREAIVDELALALAPARLRRCRAGGTWAGRAAMRLRVAGWLLMNWGTRVY